MSLLGTLLRPKSFPPSTIAACTTSSGRCAKQRRKEYDTGRRHESDSIDGGRRLRRRDQRQSFEDVFIQSLVSAGTCRACSSKLPPASMRAASREVIRGRDRSPTRLKSTRAFSTTSQRRQVEAAVQAEEEPEKEEPAKEEVIGAKISKKQYKALVDTYDAATLRKAERSLANTHYPLAPRLTITPEQEDRPPNKPREILEPIDEDHRQKIRRLQKLLFEPPGYCTKAVWQAYFDLPKPRPRYLSDKQVKRLFRHFAWVEKRDLESSQHYFSLLEDALSERVPLIPDIWNTAISFAGRWVQKTTSEDVKAAIETWLRMEREGGVAANNITFNILFDVAVKAQRFALADTIFAEMQRREMHLNRYFRTSKIYYAGLRGDGENVRAAFRELVAAGEIVDTAIMNCVIVSLVRCGEAASAENVMGKMKHLHEHKFGTASLRDWRDQKAMGRQLDKSAQKLREAKSDHLSSFFGSPYSNDDKKEEIQRAAPIAPDGVTYRILLKWHALNSGNLDKIRQYIQDIRDDGWEVTYHVYYSIFSGFQKHGGYAFTAWNRKSLEEFWTEYIHAVTGDAQIQEMATRLDARLKKLAASDDTAIYPLDPSDSMATSANDPETVEDTGEPDPLPSYLAPIEFRAGTIMAALGAFYKCAGLKRMLEVWTEVQGTWKHMSESDWRRIKDVVDERVRESGGYVER